MNIAGTSFNVRFEPERQTSAEMARLLCTQRADVIGVTQNNVDECVQKVGTYLQTSVNRWVDEKTLRVPLTVKGTPFDLRFIPERTGAVDVARRLCSEQAGTLGVTQETFLGCVEPVANYVQDAVNDHFAEKTLQVNVPIEDKVFQVSFLPERQSASEMANRLCVENAKTLGITSETLAACTNPVADYLTRAVQQWVDSKTLAFTFNYAQKPYSLSFMPERQTSASVAREFCVRGAAELGLTEQTVVANCINPVQDYIRQQVQAWVESKRLVVDITVGTEPFQIVMFPERESIAAVVRRFCSVNAAVFNLTEENAVRACINPVSDIVRDGVAKWFNSRQQR